MLFLGTLGLADGAVRASGISSGQLAALAQAFLPLLPLVAVGVVLVAGVMFELTTTSKFAGSDAANWLPVTPTEYVSASASAIAYTSSPALAIALGALLPIALLGGLAGLYALTAFLSLVALFEGAVLVEMVRSVTQRASSVTAGRRGQVNLILRAVVLIVVILALQLAFNPVFLLALAQRLSAVGIVTSFVPFFWSTEALTQWAAGSLAIGAGFAAGQLAFVGLLLYLASDLRRSYWVPSPTEVRLEPHRYASRSSFLALLGLSTAESAMVSKDLKGLVRRREMLPTLVVPIVLVILVLVEGKALGGFVSSRVGGLGHRLLGASDQRHVDRSGAQGAPIAVLLPDLGRQPRPGEDRVRPSALALLCGGALARGGVLLWTGGARGPRRGDAGRRDLGRSHVLGSRVRLALLGLPGSAPSSVPAAGRNARRHGLRHGAPLPDPGPGNVRPTRPLRVLPSAGTPVRRAGRRGGRPRSVLDRLGVSPALPGSCRSESRRRKLQRGPARGASPVNLVAEGAAEPATHLDHLPFDRVHYARHR